MHTKPLLFIKNIMKKNNLLLLLTLLTYSAVYGQSHFFGHESEISKDSISFFQIKTDTLFGTGQIISVVTLPKNSLNKFKIEFVYSEGELRKTSDFAETENALAAINGSYFDVDKGGSVTYLEINDSIIARTRSAKNKWAKPGKLINGAVILTKDNQIKITFAEPDGYYEESPKENAVIVSGPVLILNSKPVDLADMKFVTADHPRTFLGVTKEFIVFVVTDGRSEDAGGMSLYDAQKFLTDLGCIEAINLDGGGSSTMWLKNKGVVNFPSDKTGERPIANALLILKK